MMKAECMRVWEQSYNVCTHNLTLIFVTWDKVLTVLQPLQYQHQKWRSDNYKKRGSDVKLIWTLFFLLHYYFVQSICTLSTCCLFSFQIIICLYHEVICTYVSSTHVPFIPKFLCNYAQHTIKTRGMESIVGQAWASWTVFCALVLYTLPYTFLSQTLLQHLCLSEN